MLQLEKSPQTSARTHWLTPSLEIARFTLASYARSGWLLLDILLIWFIYSVFFSASKISIHGFFDIAIPTMVVETALGSSILVHRSMKSNLYLPLARLSSRSPYLYGVIIASSTLRIALYSMLLLMVTTSKNIIDISWLNVISGSLGLLLDLYTLHTAHRHTLQTDRHAPRTDHLYGLDRHRPVYKHTHAWR